MTSIGMPWLDPTDVPGGLITGRCAQGMTGMTIAHKEDTR